MDKEGEAETEPGMMLSKTCPIFFYALIRMTEICVGKVIIIISPLLTCIHLNRNYGYVFSGEVGICLHYICDSIIISSNIT